MLRPQPVVRWEKHQVDVNLSQPFARSDCILMCEPFHSQGGRAYHFLLSNS